MQYTDDVTQEDIDRGRPDHPGYLATARPFKLFGGLTRTILPALVICFLVPATVALAQEPPKPSVAANADNPISASNKLAYGFLKFTLLRSAEKMPEENYKFRPAWVVRSFGQIIGHVADAQYIFCSQARGEKNPNLKIERTKTSKADLIAALKDSFAYCDKAYDNMTDAAASQIVKFNGLDVPKLFMLTVNNMHTVEHYGNLTVYLRMKNIVPPSTEGGFDPRANK
jgi:uncharacterized damage-inducible protein DinB